MQAPTIARSRGELLGAVEAGAAQIVVEGRIDGLDVLDLRSGQSLSGEAPGASLVFRDQSDGVRVGRDNAIRDLEIRASPTARAIFSRQDVESLGDLVLERVTTVGQVQILFDGHLRHGRLAITDLTIVDADVRDREDRPSGNGVSSLQGALTIWNKQTGSSIVTAELSGVTIGSPDHPVRGGGLFVAGMPVGGRVRGSQISTGPVYCDSMIKPEMTTTIAGGVFVLYGAEDDEVVNHGPVVTYGANTVPLDNWGDVGLWTAMQGATTYGPSAIGIINAGTLRVMKVQVGIETFGPGARGCSIYAPAGRIEIETITTHGDGAAGVQVVSTLEELVVRTGIRTRGKTGASLVKGVIETLDADGVHVLEGGAITALDIHGGIAVAGEGAQPLRLEGGFARLSVAGTISAANPSATSVTVVRPAASP